MTLSYPDTYELGTSNQALGILRERLLTMEDVDVERAYVPWVDMAAAMRASGVPLFTLESVRPVRSTDLWGITLPHELTYTNVLELLDLAGIALHAGDRSDEDPLVVGGGPCAYDPEPLAPFFDAFFIGEAEDGVAEIASTHRRLSEEGAGREEVLHSLAHVGGVYVPSLYRVEEDMAVPVGPDVPARVVKRVLPELTASPTLTCPVVPYMDVVHDRATVEILRGCTRGCRFCQAGMVYRPVRERTSDEIVREAMDTLACTGYEEISLTSLSSADHSLIDEVVTRLRRRLEGSAVSISLPSTRLDAFGVGLARMISRGKKSGLTFAPEAGSQRLRDVVNKNVSEDDLFDAVSMAFGSGWHRMKLYFMIGLPTETDDDLRDIGRLTREVLRIARESIDPARRGAVRVAVSVSTFVPKSHTPFQWESQLTLEETERRQALVREAIPRKGVELSFHDARQSVVEGALARGGREAAALVEEAWRSGAVFDAWGERFSFDTWTAAAERVGVDMEEMCSAGSLDMPLPWDHVSAGLDREYLLHERERALDGEKTPDCSFAACTGCGVCDELGVEIRLAGAPRG